jgi:hypothetical protein
MVMKSSFNSSPPTNATATWAHSPNLQQTGGAGSTATFRANNGGTGWIEATVNGIPSVRHELWCGPAQLGGLDIGVDVFIKD